MVEMLPGDALREARRCHDDARDWLAKCAAEIDEKAETLQRAMDHARNRQLEPDVRQLAYKEAVTSFKRLNGFCRDLERHEGPWKVQLLASGLAACEPYVTDEHRIDLAAEIQGLLSRFTPIRQEFMAFRRRNAHKNLIFIDIDGVLLSFRYWASASNNALWPVKVEDRMRHLQLDPGSVGLLVRLCEKANAKLVLTSNWRRTWPHERKELIERLIEQGLRRDLWHPEWMLPVLPNSNKWMELAEWLEGCTEIVALILDDEQCPDDAPPLDVEDVGILPVDKYDGFGAYSYFDALDFWGVEDGTVIPPDSMPMRQGVQPYPSKITRPLRPYSPM